MGGSSPFTLRWNSWRFGTWDESDPGLGHQTRSQDPAGSAGSGSRSRLGHSSPTIPINTSQQVWKQPGTLTNAGLGSAAPLEARKTNLRIKELQGQALQSSGDPTKPSSAWQSCRNKFEPPNSEMRRIRRQTTAVTCW